jgi:hypothetical protein
MKRALFTLAALVGSIALALPAGAATTHYSAVGGPSSTYSQYDAVAALTLHEYPSAVITSAQIEAAWAPVLSDGANNPTGSNAISDAGQPGQNFLMFAGFGYTANTTLIYAQSGAKVISAANAGGVYVMVATTKAQAANDTAWNVDRAIDIVHATTKLVTSINSAGPYTMTWKVFDARYDTIGQDQFYSVAWS